MSDEKKVMETSEAEIAVHWQEEDYFHPSSTFIFPITIPSLLNC